MSNLKKLAHQSLYYFGSNTIIIMCSFISFPIWTRIFTTSEYGMFSLINITVTLGVGISKFGLQHAAFRYYSDFKEKKINLDISYYFTTILLGSVLITGAIILTSLFIVKIFFKNYLDAALAELVYLVAILIFAQSISSVLIIFIRMEEKGLLYSIISIFEKYGRLLGALTMIFYFSRNLYGFILGWVLSETVVIIFLLSMYIKKINFSHRSFSFLKEAVYYGFPLIGMELSNMLLNFGDRYLIQYFMGSEAVGVYSAGYNLSVMAQSLLAVPLRLAVTPMYLSIWNRDGEKETKTFINQILNYYFMAGIPIIIGLSWFGRDVITLLATAKFREAHIIIPYIILPLILHGAYSMYGAGLFIEKKTKILMYLTVFSLFVNVLANIILIPFFGILGAAYATAISYFLVIILIFLQSHKYLKIKIQILPLLKYTAVSFSVMFIISYLEASNIKKMLVKIIIGAILYAFGILIVEKPLRYKVLSYAGIKA